MPPIIQSISPLASGTGTSIATNAPSGVSSGDLLLLFVGAEPAASITTPSGWTLVDYLADSTAISGGVYVREADGTGSDTPTVTLGASTPYGAKTLRISSQRDTGALDAHDSFTDGATDTNLTHAAITVTDDDSLGLLLHVGGNSSAPAASYPAGWNAEFTEDAGSFSMWAASKTLPSGSTGTGVTSWSPNQRKVGFILAIRPLVLAGISYSQLERQIRGLNRGLA